MIDLSKLGIILIASSGTRALNITLFGKTAHFTLSVGALGIAVILALCALLATAAALAVVARRRAKQLEAANLELEIEIKERHRAEDEVRRLNADLERRVEERTAELADAVKQ